MKDSIKPKKIEIFQKLRVGTLPLPSQVERFYLLSRASKHQDLFAEDPPSFRDLNEDLGYGTFRDELSLRSGLSLRLGLNLGLDLGRGKIWVDFGSISGSTFGIGEWHLFLYSFIFRSDV